MEVEGTFREPVRDSRRDRSGAAETIDALDASTRSLRSSNSSGVGIASSYLQNQILMRRSLNDWDENDPRFLERQDSFDRDAEPDVHLAFRPNTNGIGQSRSDPRLSNSIPTTINGSLSAPNDLGFMRRSFMFDENALTMDESQRTGSAGALCMDDSEHIGEVDAEKEFLKLLMANNEFMTRESSSDSESCSSDYESNKSSELDVVIRKGQALEQVERVNFGSQNSIHSSDHSSHFSNLEDVGDDTPKMSNGNDVVNTVTDLPQVPSVSVSEQSPSSTDTLHELADMSKPIRKSQRTLSQVSLVSLLKIQSIAENDAFNDSLNEINLEETVTFAKMSDEGSVISELGDSNRDGNDGALISQNVEGMTLDDESSNATNDRTNESGEDLVRIDIMPLAGCRNSPVNELDISELSDEHRKSSSPKPKSTGSFLPLPKSEARIIQNPPRSRSSSLVDEESSDFFLQSIKSTDHVTHVSDAPDYDYNSMSSDEKDAKASRTNQNQPKSEEFVSPTERPRRSLENKDKRASDQVCGLLGLPKDEGARMLNRGIMSKDTELQLRNLLKREQAEEQKKHNITAVNTSESSSDDSVQKVDDQKWERVRQQRLLKRQSSKKLQRALSDGQPTEPQDKTSYEADGVRNSRPIKINEVNFDQRNERSLHGTSTEAKREANDEDSTKSEVSSSTEDVVSNVRWSINQNSTSSERTNGELPKRAMPRKSTCPMIRVEDDDSTVFSNFNKSIRNLLGKPHRNSDASNESNAQSCQSKPALKRTGSVMNLFGKSPPLDEEKKANRDSKSTNGSRRNSTLAAFLGWRPSSFSSTVDVDGDEDVMESDDESTDDEGDETSWNGNILSEGEYYLAMSMLVYMYALLRETAMLGHTDISFDEVDVNSFHSELDSIDGILAKTKSAGFIIRVVLDELEKKDAFETVSDTSVLKEFKKWVSDSRCTQVDVATESTIKELRQKVARTRWKRAITAVRITLRLKKSSSHITFDKNKLHSDPAFDKKQTKTLSGLSARKGRAALSQSMMWVTSAKTQIMSSLGVDSPNDDQNDAKDNQRSNTLVDKDEIKKIINDALEQPRFFRQGSLMSNLIDSGIEVVWFGDRHPNDVVYSICCNRKQKRVSVVFRGTVNSHNWLMNMKFSMAEHVNPIADDYYGRSPFFGLHTGFSLYLSRQRKDDSNTKIEEIFSMIDEIGRAIAPDGDYNLSITGHSLGGALATLLSFYAATSSMFDNVKTIRVFTYAAPRVGCQRFLYAYQHLERIGKIRLARFSNTQDVVPLIPFTCVDKFKIGRPYMHVGMHIRLHGTSNWAQYWLRNALDVTWPKQQGLLSHIKRGFLNSVFINLNTLKGFAKNHTLSEYQRRIHFALEFRNALAKTSLKYDKRRNRVKTLEEYYFIRGATTVTCTKDLTQVNLETREGERGRRQMQRMVTVLVIIALVEGIALLRVLDISLSCQSVPMLLYPFLCFVCSHDTNEPKANDTPHAPSLPEKSASLTAVETADNLSLAFEDVHHPGIVTTDPIATTVPTKTTEAVNTNNVDDDMTSDKSEFVTAKEHMFANDVHEDHISVTTKEKAGWQRRNDMNLFYKTSLIWGTRRDHHNKVPSNIVEQRMKLFDSTSLLAIPPFAGTPNVQKVESMLSGFVQTTTSQIN